ncbi:F-box protein-like protein [Tanacetum coccineum]
MTATSLRRSTAATLPPSRMQHEPHDFNLNSIFGCKICQKEVEVAFQKKKKRSRSKEDVLPVELIHRIQSLLPLKEAARTRILSKSWLHAWYTIPTLRIIPSKPNKSFSTVEDARKYNKLIRTTLQSVYLRVLDLKYVVISEDVLHNLLSVCSLLEKIKLLYCKGLKNVKVKNLLRLTELDILSVKEKDDRWEINNIPRLCSFCYRTLFTFYKPIPFQIDSLASVTKLYIVGVIIDDLFFNTLESKFSVLESLTLGIKSWEHENMFTNSVSLKWLTLILIPTGPVVNVQVYAPRLLSFIYTGKIPGLLFQTTAPEQVKLNFIHREDFGHTYFLNMNEALNSSSKFDINIESANLDSVVHLKYIDVDDLKRRVLFPVGNVQLKLETRLHEHV